MSGRDSAAEEIATLRVLLVRCRVVLSSTELQRNPVTARLAQALRADIAAALDEKESAR